MSGSSDHIHTLTDHLFRHEAGRMVAVLTKVFGTENLETAEDVVQDTLLQAMQTWKIKGPPENPSAWLYRVAKNKAIDIIRRNKHSLQYDFSDSEHVLFKSEYTLATAMEQAWQEELVKDDQLRMMFACCHPGISEENQVTLILKTLCGFSTAEIAKTFLTGEDTVSKRLYRAKEFFREHKIKLGLPAAAELKSRTHAVLNSIYLLFNEGYNSTSADELIRSDLMHEAMALCRLLTENELTALPECFALMALICFHAARSESRLGPGGDIILLPDQDRGKWNRDLIDRGNEYMAQAASGDAVTAYHIEAAIAYEHCSAPTFEETSWERILLLYEWLCRVSPSPVAELNKAVAVMQLHGPGAALQALEKISGQKNITSFYLYHSLLGEIYSRMNLLPAALQAFEAAIALTQSEAEKKTLRKKAEAIRDRSSG